MNLRGSIVFTLALLPIAPLAGCASARPAGQEARHPGAAVADASAVTPPPATPLAHPATRTVHVVDDYHGTLVPDPYRWVEEVSSEETRAWAAAQTAMAGEYLAGDVVRDRVRERMREIIARADDIPYSLTPERAGGREFFREWSQEAQREVLVVRAVPGAVPRLLVDPRSLSPAASLATYAISSDGLHVAYALSDGGSDWVVTRVVNVAAGEVLPEVLHGLVFTSIPTIRRRI